VTLLCREETFGYLKIQFLAGSEPHHGLVGEQVGIGTLDKFRWSSARARYRIDDMGGYTAML